LKTNQLINQPIKHINKKHFNFELLFVDNIAKFQLHPGNSTLNTEFGVAEYFFTIFTFAKGSRVGVGVGSGRLRDSTKKTGGFSGGHGDFCLKTCILFGLSMQ